MYSTLLFDLDGTLIDSLADITTSVNSVRARFDLPPLAESDVRAAVGDGLPKLLERTVPVAAPGLRELYSAHHEAHCLDRTRVYPGVREGLERWRGRAALAVVSNKPQAFCERVLEGLGIRDAFAAVLGGDTPAGRKPEPGPIEHLLHQLGAPPWSALTIGDSPGDLRAGRAAGTATAAVGWGYRSRELLLAEQPDHWLDDLGELDPLLAVQGERRVSVYELVGAETLRRLAAAFYARVDRDPRIRSMFPRSLTGPAERQALFLIQFFGGPHDYSQQRGHPRLRMRHVPFAIDAEAAAAWLENMLAAIDEVGIPAGPAGVMRRYFAHTARFLINRPS
jgi:phosphoglycolate phosphatase